MLQRLVALAGSTIELLLQIGNGGASTKRSLWRFAALWRYRPGASRFYRLAGCPGALFHCLPLGLVGSIVSAQTDALEGAKT